MFCPKCGVQNADSSRFCKGCGAPLASPATKPASAPESAPKSISASAPAGYADIQSQQIVPPKKSGKKFIIIIAVVIALAAASVGGFFIVKNLTSGNFKGSIAVYSAEEGGMNISVDDEKITFSTAPITNDIQGSYSGTIAEREEIEGNIVYTLKDITGTSVSSLPSEMAISIPKDIHKGKGDGVIGMMFSGTEPDGRAYAGVFRLKLTNNSEFTTEMYQMQYFFPDGESMTYGSDLAKLLIAENLKETIDDYAIAHNKDLENYNQDFSKITGFDGTLEKQSDTEYELWAYGECLNMTVTPK